MAARQQMVEVQLKARGVRDPRVLEACGQVPRHLFVPAWKRSEAYGDHPLLIGHEQTISQPYIVGCMTEALALAPSGRVLEVGTGSGYQTAILAELAGVVHTIERMAPLASAARDRLGRLGYRNVCFRTGDGSLGWAEAGPFDGILVAAGAPRVPPSLKDQLGEGGTLVVPAGSRRRQGLYAVTRQPDGSFEQRKLCDCVFVQLVGEQGWEN